MTFADDLNRMLGEAIDPGTFYLNSGTPVDLKKQAMLTVTQIAGHIPVSMEMLVDSGAISEADARAQGWTPYVLPPLLWRHRVRRRWWEWRERVGRRVGGWIAGVDLTERDED